MEVQQRKMTASSKFTIERVMDNSNTVSRQNTGSDLDRQGPRDANAGNDPTILIAQSIEPFKINPII